MFLVLHYFEKILPFIFIYTYIIYICIYHIISYRICVICVISKRTSSLRQNLIKNKESETDGKICQKKKVASLLPCAFLPQYNKTLGRD